MKKVLLIVALMFIGTGAFAADQPSYNYAGPVTNAIGLAQLCDSGDKTTERAMCTTAIRTTLMIVYEIGCLPKNYDLEYGVFVVRLKLLKWIQQNPKIATDDYTHVIFQHLHDLRYPGFDVQPIEACHPTS